jgi:hypothetical protein
MRLEHFCLRGLALASALLAVVSGVCAQVVPEGASAGVGRAMSRIEAPEPSGCITDVGPGDHAYSCDGITYLVMVDKMCTQLACGLILDIHGASMSAEIMRANTGLQKLAPSKGYLVVHPSAAPFMIYIQPMTPLFRDFSLSWAPFSVPDTISASRSWPCDSSLGF